VSEARPTVISMLSSIDVMHESSPRRSTLPQSQNTKKASCGMSAFSRIVYWPEVDITREPEIEIVRMSDLIRRRLSSV